jgi:hypothetical protein
MTTPYRYIYVGPCTEQIEQIALFEERGCDYTEKSSFLTGSPQNEHICFDPGFYIHSFHVGLEPFNETASKKSVEWSSCVSSQGTKA